MGKWPTEKIVRWVTIYTDAGWKEGRARVGFIARSSLDPYWLTGSGSVGCDSVQAAEGVAVLHALRKVGAAFHHPKGLEGFFLRSDNQQVVNVLGHLRLPHEIRDQKISRLRGDFRKVVEGVFSLCDALDWSLQVRHVRAHGKEPDRIRRWMNSHADRLGNMRGISVAKPTSEGQ